LMRVRIRREQWKRRGRKASSRSTNQSQIRLGEKWCTSWLLFVVIWLI
jgi:hypothetical protein